MAFGDIYGYKTNSRLVAATAESAERTRVIDTVLNPDYTGDPGADNDPEGDAEYVDVTQTVVDLVLLGFANGRRSNCVVMEDDVTGFNDVPTNQCVRGDVASALTGEDSVAPGETTARNYSTGHVGDGTGAIA